MRFLAAALFILLPLIPLRAQHASKVKLLCNWNDTTNCPVNGGGQHWNDVWGFVNKGKEYAVIGGTSGGHVIDIDACEERAYLPTRSTGVIHRDYKTYKNYLYCVADEGINSTMQVWDFSYLPDSMHFVWESLRTDINRVHNIFIDTAKGRLYCGTESYLGGYHDMSIWSLADPRLPNYITSVDGMGKTHDMYARNDTVWCSNGGFGYVVLDVSQLPAYRILGGLATYPYKGYNHSSWIGYDYIGVMADETFGLPLKVIDVRNPSIIEVLSTFSPRGTDSTCIPHNPFLLGNYVFISYYQDGLQIFDISDPRHPVQAGYYDTYPAPDAQVYAGAWGCYPYLPSRRILVSDMHTGLYVLDAREVLNAGGITVPNTVFSIYPNPVGNELTLSLPPYLIGALTCEVYDMAGRLACRMDAPHGNGQTRLTLPADIAPGLYMLRATVGGQRYTARFTKR